MPEDGIEPQFREIDVKALQDFAWIMSEPDRREVEDTAVHIWRHREREVTESIIERWLPDELREDYERRKREEEG